MTIKRLLATKPLHLLAGLAAVGALAYALLATRPVAAGKADFSVSASPASRAVAQSSNTTYTVTITPINSFTGTVYLTASGLPSGALATFAPASLKTGTSVMTVTTAAATPTTTSTLYIKGTSGAVAHTASVTMSVAPAAPASPTPSSPISPSTP